jgi:signal transduction histidine kinase/putative methionine-R-sulfoxide reductase with GAF domain
VRGRLFRKYVALFVAVVSVALIANGLFEIWFSYREHQEALVRIQREQAESAAAKIAQFVSEIRNQLGWTTQLPWSSATMEQRRVDALRLLRQVPAITELEQLDPTGHEQLRVSRLAMDVVGSGIDMSREPKFTEAMAHKVYYGPVYFRRQSEPYMTLALAGTIREDGVSVAEVNLKFIWDVVSQIKVGEHGHAYVVDADGRLIAHPDISLVLRNTDLSGLAQVKEARAERAGAAADPAQVFRNLEGHRVLSAHAAIAPLGWTVFVELPLAEAYAPLYASMQRSGALLLGGLLLAFLAGLLLARRMVVPIEALRTGAARIGGGDLGQRIAIRTGDELEALADQFNDMAGKLQESYADLEKKVDLRTRELSEALEQQTATAEVLRVISSSPGELQPVFETMLANATRICEAKFAMLYRYDGQSFRAEAMVDVPKAHAEFLRGRQMQFGEDTALGKALRTKRPEQIADCRTSKPYLEGDPVYVAVVELGRARTLLAVPMLKEDEVIGAVVIYRQEVRPFTQKQIELVASFANQAVIAMENARLMNETREALERQIATSEVLRVISSSPGELKPVFDTMLANATRICEAQFATLYRYENGTFIPVATIGVPEAFAEYMKQKPRRPSTLYRVAESGQPVHVLDLAAEQPYLDRHPDRVAIVELGGARTLLAVPMLKEHELVGVFSIYRKEVRPFTEKQIELVTSFADQALIAIENARLLNELRDRTTDLSEALEQQTATAEVLRVISSSPSDLQPVFDIILANATRICQSQFGILRRYNGRDFEIAAMRSVPSAFAEYLTTVPKQPSPGLLFGRALASRQTMHLIDAKANKPYLDGDPTAVAAVELGGARTMLSVPMLKDNEPLGTITIYRQEVRPFTEKQIELVTSFASQAVIAIENVRLLNELRDRTTELARSVEELNALGEVSQAVNSTLDIEMVLETIVAKAVQLSRTDAGAIYVFDETLGTLDLRATYGMDERLIAGMRAQSGSLSDRLVGRAAQSRAPLQVPDLNEEPPSMIRELLLGAGFRAVMAVPLLSPDAVVGMLVVRRRETGSFASSAVELLQTFAAQSVLAIQNARLFREIEDKGRQLEIASRHKSEFLANMSHELRTPLNAILGYSELLIDGIYGEPPEKFRTVLERVQGNGRHLLGLINDVLDLSKIEAGQLNLTVEDYSMAALVKSVVAATESLARNKGLSLSTVIQEGLPLGRGDERRLTQVLVNLVGNAIKFTDHGSVEIAARAADGRFMVSVRDTGPGIAEADQARIFEEFQQVDATSTRKKGGTGLGLAIAKRIVGMHGGMLTVESALGTGSTFYMTVPVRVREGKEAA